MPDVMRRKSELTCRCLMSGACSEGGVGSLTYVSSVLNFSPSERTLRRSLATPLASSNMISLVKVRGKLSKRFLKRLSLTIGYRTTPWFFLCESFGISLIHLSNFLLELFSNAFSNLLLQYLLQCTSRVYV